MAAGEKKQHEAYRQHQHTQAYSVDMSSHWFASWLQVIKLNPAQCIYTKSLPPGISITQKLIAVVGSRAPMLYWLPKESAFLHFLSSLHVTLLLWKEQPFDDVIFGDKCINLLQQLKRSSICESLRPLVEQPYRLKKTVRMNNLAVQVKGRNLEKGIWIREI